MLVATVGIGSNSLRMLIVEIKDAQFKRVLRDREGLRVFAALDERRNISKEMLEKAAQSVLSFVNKARALHVEKIHVFATSAVRDASNQEAFCERIYEATGLMPEICSGELEAKLSFWGATGTMRSGLIDIGGGSTEIVIGQGEQIDYSVSLQMGAVRLQRRHPIQTGADAREVVEIAKGILAPEVKRIKRMNSVDWVGVGGTLTTAAALLQNISWTDKERIHGYQASRAAIHECVDWIAPMDVDRRASLNGLHPQRADIVVHGLCILLGCMEMLSIPYVRVSECGNLEGYLKYLYCKH